MLEAEEPELAEIRHQASGSCTRHAEVDPILKAEENSACSQMNEQIKAVALARSDDMSLLDIAQELDRIDPRYANSLVVERVALTLGWVGFGP